MIFYYILGAIAYSFQVLVSYSSNFKNSKLYLPAGLAVGLTANFFWLLLARSILSPEKLFISSLYWDSMIICVYAAVPILFMGVSLSMNELIGATLIVCGMVISKI